MSHDLFTQRNLSRGHTSVPATCCRNSNEFEFKQQVSETKFCPREKVFLVHTVGFVPETCHCDMSPRLDASYVLTFKLMQEDLQTEPFLG